MLFSRKQKKTVIYNHKVNLLLGEVSLGIFEAIFLYKVLMLPNPPIVKSEEEIEYLYARKMAKHGPFQITRNPNSTAPIFNKTGHWSEK